MLTNQILCIHPFRDGGTWVFDDAATGLEREPFVLGMNEIIDDAVGINTNRFTAFFSASPFPKYDLALTRQEAEYDGTWYVNEATGRRGWLCPALFKYFAEAPANIYLKVELGLAAVPKV